MSACGNVTTHNCIYPLQYGYLVTTLEQTTGVGLKDAKCHRQTAPKFYSMVG